MKATAELPSRVEKAEPDIVFSCICSNEFMLLINVILPYMYNDVFTIKICNNYLFIYDFISNFPFKRGM